MKKIFFLTLIFSSVSYGKSFSDEIINYFDKVINDYQKYSTSHALITSKSDLAIYSAIQDKSFPLNKLTPKNRLIFTQSLTFNETGLTSYNYDSLKDLNTMEVYKVLSLFGAQRTLLKIRKVDNQIKMLPPNSEDHIGYSCASRATCETDSGHICMTGC